MSRTPDNPPLESAVNSDVTGEPKAPGGDVDAMLPPAVAQPADPGRDGDSFPSSPEHTVAAELPQPLPATVSQPVAATVDPAASGADSLAEEPQAATSRLRHLRDDRKSTKRFVKNLVVWIIGAVILLAVVLFLLRRGPL